MKTAVYKGAERKNHLTVEDDDRPANQNQFHMIRQSERYDQVILICFDL